MSADVRDVTFYQDDGHLLRGQVVHPGHESEPRPFGIVFCHGYGGTIDHLAPDIASDLAAATDAEVLIFDYSGFGQSEGPLNRLDPIREVRDVRAALDWFAQQSGRASDSLFLYGTSFGAAVATVAAGQHASVRGVVAVSGFYSGRRWMQDLRPNWQWIEFQELLAEDRQSRVVTGQSEVTDPDLIMPRDPESAAYNKKTLETYPERRKFRLDLVSAERIVEFDVAELALGLRGRRSLFVHCERDLLMPYTHSRELAERFGGEFYLVPRAGHYDIYRGPVQRQIAQLAGDWYSSVHTACKQ